MPRAGKWAGSAFTPIVLKASFHFIGFVSSLSLILSPLTTQWIKTSFGFWDQRRPWSLLVLAHCYIIIISHTDTHSLGPGTVVSSADTAVVDSGVSGVGGRFVVVASGRGVVPTLLGDMDADLIISNSLGVISAGDPMWGKRQTEKVSLNLFQLRFKPLLVMMPQSSKGRKGKEARKSASIAFT